MVEGTRSDSAASSRRSSLSFPTAPPAISTTSYVTSSAAGPSSAQLSGSSSSRRSSPLSSSNHPKGKGKGKEHREEDQLGGTRVEVKLTFPTDLATSDGSARANVHMVGGFATQSTYALPVEVLLSVLPAPSSASGSSFWTSSSCKGNKFQGCLVKAVELTYEARTEFYDYTSYSSMRIHQQTHRVVLPTPLYLPFDDHSHPSPTYSLPLDVLRLPGWLPQTFYLPYATLTSSVSATVELVNVPSASASASGSGWSKLGRAGSSLQKPRFSRSAEVEVTIERLRVPKVLATPMLSGSSRDRAMLDELGFQMRHYSLKTEAESPIDCVISVAEFMPFDTPSFEFNVRVRSSSSWKESGHEKLHLISMEYAVEQVERYTSTPSKTYARTYPVPEEQPITGYPLRQGSSLHTLADLGIFVAASHRSTRVVPLFQAEGGGARSMSFSEDEGDLAGGQWKKLELRAEKPRTVIGKSGAVKQGEKSLIAAMSTPFLKVAHALKIKIICRDPDASTDTVILLNSPLRFVATPGTGARRSTSATPNPSTALAATSYRLPYRLPQSILPAYVSLFFESQTAREDPEPLPLYTPDEEAKPLSPLLASSVLMGEGATDDPVVALLEERATLERVHGIGRRPSRLEEPDVEDEVEDLVDLVDRGRSSPQSSRSGPRADSPAPSGPPRLVASTPLSPTSPTRQSRRRRLSTLGSISSSPHWQPPTNRLSDPPQSLPGPLPRPSTSATAGADDLYLLSSSTASCVDEADRTSFLQTPLEPSGSGRGRTRGRPSSLVSSRSSLDGSRGQSRESSVERENQTVLKDLDRGEADLTEVQMEQTV